MNPGSADETAEPLLARVAEGDEDAIQQCVDRYGRLVWSVARRTFQDLGDAEDAVQEVFLSLWKSAGRYDPAVASESTFVMMVARRRLIDRQRRTTRIRGREVLSAEVPDMAVETDDPAESTSLEVARAREALDRLRPDQRRVLILSIDKGLSHREIADETGLPLGTVKTHARRGLERIRRLLGADQPEEMSS